MYRLFLLQDLEAVTTREANPTLLGFLREYVLLDNIQATRPVERKQVVAYEKAKALRVLWQLAPDSLPLIREAAKSLPHGRYLLDPIRQLEEEARGGDAS